MHLLLSSFYLHFYRYFYSCFSKRQKSVFFNKYKISRFNWLSWHFLYIVHQLITKVIFILSATSRDLEGDLSYLSFYLFTVILLSYWYFWRYWWCSSWPLSPVILNGNILTLRSLRTFSPPLTRYTKPF